MLYFTFNHSYRIKYNVEDYEKWVRVPNVNPVMAKILYTGYDHADLSCLISQFLVLQNTVEVNQIEDKFVIVFLNNPNDEFLRFLMEEVGNGKQVTLEDISEFPDKKLRIEFIKWTYRVAIGKSKYVDNNKTRIHGMLKVSIFAWMIITILLVTITLIFFAESLWISIALSSLGLFSVLLTKKITFSTQIYTPLGQELLSELKALRSFLSDPLNNKKLMSTNYDLWKSLIPFSISLEINPSSYSFYTISHTSNLNHYFEFASALYAAFLKSPGFN
ncbi:DUF2207 family protein [Companilactobacillus mishanensis]